MNSRCFGKTDLAISPLGFGCGAVGGLLVKGSRADMIRAVARAVDLGITYFDTAAAYGQGISETNLGMAVREAGADVVIGTKIRLSPGDLRDVEDAVTRLVDESLSRLGREAVDLIQLHNFVSDDPASDKGWLTINEVEDVLGAFAKLRDKGKLRYWGINGLGDVAAAHRCTDADLHCMQVCFNLLNPTAGMPAPAGFPFLDYRQIIDRAAMNGLGILAIRVLAGGALTGHLDRHAHTVSEIEPIASGESYADDVQLARRLGFLVTEGFADSLPEAAIRFAIGKGEVSSVVVGLSDVEQLEAAVRYADKGPLAADAMARLQQEWLAFGRR